MSHKHRDREDVYAVLRFDAFQATAESRPEQTVTVKEVVRNKELAIAEVKRLNRVNGDNNVRYWWQPTRLFPENSAAGEHSN